MAHRPGDRVAGGPVPARRAPRRASKRGATGGAARIAAQLGGQQRRAAGRWARCRRRRRPRPGRVRRGRRRRRGRGARQRTEAGLITLLLTPRSPIRYTCPPPWPRSRPHPLPRRAAPPGRAARGAGGRGRRPRCAPSTSPISRAESPSTKRSDRRPGGVPRRARDRGAQPTRIVGEAGQARRVVRTWRRLRHAVERSVVRWRPRARSALASWLCAMRNSHDAEGGALVAVASMAPSAATNVRSVASSASWWSPSR